MPKDNCMVTDRNKILKKIKAYTLIEILVVLVLTSIISILAINLYFQFIQVNRKITKDYASNADLVQLKSVLNIDFEASEHIEYSLFDLNFKRQNTSCRYEFTDFGILRKSKDKIDTFRFEYSNLDFERENGNIGKLTKFSFDVKYNGKDFPFVFYKNYSNESKINKQIFR